MNSTLLRTPLWRAQLQRARLRAEFPALSFVARVYRATLARNVRTVAVTGSFGKTTTGRAIAAVLETGDERWRFAYAASKLRPPYSVLHMRPRDRHAVMEVGIGRPGEMARYARVVRPDVVVVTTVGSEHNTHLRNLDVTRTEKAALVRALPSGGLAVLNGDDPNVRWMATQTAARVRTFGLDASNDVWASDVAIDWPHGTRFVLHAGGESRPARTRLIGRHFVYPILAALTVAIAEGSSLDRALARIEALLPTPRRLEPVQLPNGAIALYDHYKSPVETIDAALDVLAEIPARRKLVVLGDVTEPPERTLAAVHALYDRLGARVAAIADRAVFVHVDTGGPRPCYAPAAIQAGMAEDAIATTVSAPEAVEAIAADLGPGDVVLIKGAKQQRFDRIALALAGRRVRCDIQVCTAWMECPRCPMLERRWDGPALPTSGPDMGRPEEPSSAAPHFPERSGPILHLGPDPGATRR